jgi:hypothetical protein
LTSSVFYKIGILSAAMAFFGYAISQRETLDNVAGKRTIQFVKDTLTNAGYSIDQIKKVKILSGKPFCSTRNCIYVPFNDEQLLRAQKYYETSNDKEGKDIAANYLSKLREIKLFDEMSDNDLLNFLQFEGKAITKDSIPFWRGAIIHEMGHIVHNHVAKVMLFLATVGSFITAYSVAWMHQNKKLQKCLNDLGRLECAYVAPATFVLMTVLFLSGRLWRPYEIEADDEMIRRTKNPEILKSTMNMFQSIGKLHQMQNKWKQFLVNCLYYFDPHPRGDVRADRMRKAYQKMINQTD